MPAGHPGRHLPPELPLDAHPQQSPPARSRPPRGRRREQGRQHRVALVRLLQRRQRRAGAEGHAGVGGARPELAVEGCGVGVEVVGGEGGVHDDGGGGVVVVYRGRGSEQGEARAGRAEGEPQDEGKRH